MMISLVVIILKNDENFMSRDLVFVHLTNISHQRFNERRISQVALKNRRRSPLGALDVLKSFVRSKIMIPLQRGREL